MVNFRASGSPNAEAAAWLARLQGDARNPASEAAFKDWLQADPAHAEAFERATDIWSILPGAAQRMHAADRTISTHPRAGVRQFALAASLLLVAGLSLLLWLSATPSVYYTEVGEQKIATLEDGSRVALNTDSSIQIRYDADRRLVELEHGEAMFEVAHNAARPFLVRAGTKQVRAVGTSFIVRRQGGEVVVTLIEGKVAVTDIGPLAGRSKPAMLVPGDRWRAPAQGAARIDAQPPEAATAWRRGQTVFTDTPLAEAIGELNRYGGPRLVVDDARIAAMPVSGVFSTNDTEEFARAVAALHRLHLVRRADALHIVR